MPDMKETLTEQQYRACTTVEYWEKPVQGSTGTYMVTYGQLDEQQREFQGSEYGYTCTCPAFQYRPGPCKHIEQVKHERCAWNESALEGSAEPHDGDTCPECGGPLTTVKVAT